MNKPAWRAMVFGLIPFAFALAEQNASSPPSAPAQPSDSYESRAEELETKRKRREEKLPPVRESRLERILLQIQERRLLEKSEYGWHGLKPRIGALVTGSGFAVGPEYRRDDLAGGKLDFRVTTQFSTNLFQLYETELIFPKLADGRVFFSVAARHRNYPQMQYYGPGPDSAKSGRSNYRLEDNRFSLSAGTKPIRHVTFGVGGSLLQVNVGPGTRRQFISTERSFSPAQAPGIDRQSDFFQGHVFVNVDTRDNVLGPRSGSRLFADYTWNKDIDLETGSHRRLDLEAQQYLPFLNRRRVIALRARSELTWKDRGQFVPFYLQPVLGGSDDLRGFRPFRFHDDNLILFNAEYRYEIFAGLDMAIFGDAGKVFRSKNDWNLEDLEGVYGIGMRFNARGNVVMRLDAGFSHEGFQVWLKFTNIF
ncbi:MAG: BamA/TamA family outer membrane protein [Bryobacteraceae bacterium]|nr:BamA/TamA family outer membrane protein [Bryobacteraceae bacterium]